MGRGEAFGVHAREGAATRIAKSYPERDRNLAPPQIAGAIGAVRGRLADALRRQPVKIVQQWVGSSEPTAKKNRRGEGRDLDQFLRALGRLGARRALAILEPLLGDLSEAGIRADWLQLQRELAELGRRLDGGEARVLVEAISGAAGDPAWPGLQAGGGVVGVCRREVEPVRFFVRRPVEDVAAAPVLIPHLSEFSRLPSRLDAEAARSFVASTGTGLAGAVEIDRVSGEVRHSIVGDANPLYTDAERAAACGRLVADTKPAEWRACWAPTYADAATSVEPVLGEIWVPGMTCRTWRLSLTRPAVDAGKLVQVVSCWIEPAQSNGAAVAHA